MPDHWEWALSQVERIPEITHITVLTDRMIFKPGAMDRLAALVAESPGSIISYSHDRVEDDSTPVRLQCEEWSGITLEVTSARLLELSATMAHYMALPRMLNCVVPVEHLQKIKEVFGNVFGDAADSVAPDFCFAYRTLSQVDSIKYVDESLLVHGAIARSNGASYAHGRLSSDHADFVAKLGGRSLNLAAPVPGFETVWNTIISEYESVRRQTGLPRFVPVDMDAYFAKMEAEISQIREPSVSSRMRELLLDSRGVSLTAPRLTLLGRLQRRLSKGPCHLAKVLLIAAVSSWPTKWLWRWAGVKPPRTRYLRFRNAEEAFEFAQSPGLHRSRNNPALQLLAATAALSERPVPPVKS